MPLVNPCETPPGLLHAAWSLTLIIGRLLGRWLAPAAERLPFLVAGLLEVGAILLAYHGRKALRSPTET